MIGAILGDIIGSPYEYDRGSKMKDFPLFSKESRFTDDTVMTIAVADALLERPIGAEDEAIQGAVIWAMQRWGRKYPYEDYGIRFSHWLREKDPKPYNSCGNGSAMRTAAVGWLYPTLEQTEHVAALVAGVTHNHPEGIKGAVVTSGIIFLARNGAAKQELREYAERHGYDLSRTCDEIRPMYHHIEICQQTVPEAITAFLEGQNFEDVIRTAVSLGGDCDTLTCIAGAMAEAFYGVPESLQEECRKRLPKDILDVVDKFEQRKLYKRWKEPRKYRYAILYGDDFVMFKMDNGWNYLVNFDIPAIGVFTLAGSYGNHQPYFKVGTPPLPILRKAEALLQKLPLERVTSPRWLDLEHEELLPPNPDDMVEYRAYKRQID